jgi:predicted ATP-dependent protease
MNLDRHNMTSMASFISTHCQRESLRHFDRTAVAGIVEYSARLADHQRKLSTRFNELVEIIYEADAWAQLDGAGVVSGSHVKRAIAEKIYRSDKYEQKLQELLTEGKILLDLDGEKIGQVNGLSVQNSGDYVFARPSRITAVTYPGRRGIVNIEREIRLSGQIHDKGMLTLGGYLAHRFARERPLSLSASITFEQLYGGVEGDSASSAELYALLSSLADLPLRQDLAVTGSVNQWGEIQPVGGVTHKIEGFFKACRLKGLTGNQGVIIPVQNINNLNLSDEVLEAVHAEKFHIYPVASAEEGVEILTGMPAGRADDGNFPPGSVFWRVAQKLDFYYQRLKKDDNNDGEKDSPDSCAGSGPCH